MRVCPHCGTENPDERDFCVCGEYLRWDPTRFVPAVTPGQAEPVAPPPAPPPTGDSAATAVQPAVDATPPRPDPIMLALRLPDADGATDEPPTLRVDPGGHARLLGLVRNQSGIVDNYDVQVRGLRDDWWSADPATVYLVPYGAAGRGTYEQEVTIDIHPPRSPDAEAGPWPIEVVAVSKAVAGEEAAAPAVVELAPYAELTAELRPERAGGRLGARFDLAVENRANAPAEVELSAVDAEGSCRFGFGERRLTVRPGRRGATRVRVRPRRSLWIGRPVERRFDVNAHALHAAGPPTTCQGVFRQRPWLPWWLPVALVPLLLLALLIYALIPSTTTVPDLSRAASVFDAQKLLDEANLKLAPQLQQKAVRGKRPGAILDQTPDAGEEVDKDSEVKLLVAVGSGKRKVPSVVGLTPVGADKALREAGLALGAVQPQPDPKAKIKSQIPAARELVRGGTPVNVFLAPAAKDGKADKKGGGALPALAGLTAAAAAAKLAEAGFVPETVQRISEAKAGALIGTEPPAGARLARGAKVRLLVSAGFPRLAFDNGKDVLIAGGAKGKPVRKAAGGSLVEEEPAWSPDATHLAYRSGQQIVIAEVTPRGVGAAVPITDPNEDFRDPTFAPTGEQNLLALIRKRADGTDLCFAAVGGSQARTSCIEDGRLDIGPPVSWAPDGRSLLAFAVARDDRDHFGLIRYTTARPFSVRAQDWDRGRIVSDVSKAGRGAIAGAISPDGKRLAVVANVDAPQFHLLLASASDFRLARARSLPVQACSASWRPDGRELAVVQSDARCTEVIGQLLRVDPAKPNDAAVLRAGAAHPAWQPLRLRP